MVQFSKLNHVFIKPMKTVFIDRKILWFWIKKTLLQVAQEIMRQYMA